MADHAAMEALLWSDLGNRLALGVVLTATVEVVEQQARCDIISQRAQFVLSLATNLAQRACELTASQSAAAAAAREEADRWQVLMDATVAESLKIASESAAAAAAAKKTNDAVPTAPRDAPSASAGATSDTANGVNFNGETKALREQLEELRQTTDRAKRECAAAETRLLELKTRELAATGEGDTLRHRNAELRTEMEKLRESVAALRSEELGVGEALRQRQVESLDVRRELEGQLTVLRLDVKTAQEHLMSLRTEVATMEGERAALKAAKADDVAMQSRVASVVREVTSGSFRTSVSSSEVLEEENAVPSLAPRPTSAMVNGDAVSPHSRASGSAPSPTRSRAAAPPPTTTSIESGLQALQNVRDQLRDLRGQSAPLGVSNSASSYGSPTSRLDDSALQRAHTAYYSNPREGLIGAARLQTSSSAILESSAAHLGAASPWKQRLVKLQGDLKALRSELATPSTATH